jgi:hypothetical protein
MTTFLETPEDMAWLADVHTPLARAYLCAILHGNEDAPNKVELFAANHYKCKPTVLAPNEEGNLKVVQWGRGPRHTFGKLIISEHQSKHPCT